MFLKKTFKSILVLFLCVVALYAFAACAEDGKYGVKPGEGCLNHDYVDGICIACGKSRQSEGLEFALSDNNTSYSVIGIGICKNYDIVIPSEYEGLPVTGIGDGAFDGCDNLTIYCEAESQPSGWNSGWNYSNCPVVLGYVPEE